MRWGVAGTVLGLMLAGFPGPAAAAEPPVTLVVGLRSPADVVQRTGVDALDSAPITGGLTVDVPAGQADAAAGALRVDPAVTYVEPDHIGHATAAPDDPAYPSQWGVPRARVDAAWTTTHGSAGVVVAVVDTGVTAIPELAGRLLPGHDFVNGDADADDDNGHGTMTAGVIAAAGGNGVGTAGICWACRILPVKVLDASGSGSYSAIAEGIRYAADSGAEIINLSLGGADDGQVLRDAVAYAVGKGALVLAAAGNDGSTAPHYPAAIPAAVAVGASTATDTRYPWSDYGASWVDLAAPGCNPAPARNGGVGQFCGTSSATPFAAGVAALLASTSPPPSAARIRTALTASADALAGGWVAAGRINAENALHALPAAQTEHATLSTTFRYPAPGTLVRGTIGVGALAAADAGVSRVQLLAGTLLVGTDTTSPYAFRWRTARTGPVTLTLRTYDRAGSVTLARRTVTADNTAPAAGILSAPRNGTRNVRRTKYVSAYASDYYGVRSLELIVDGKITQRYAGRSHRFSVQTWKHGAAMTVRVRAYDRAGNVRYTPARTWYR
jgi:subtilisin family serine protease